MGPSVATAVAFAASGAAWLTGVDLYWHGSMDVSWLLVVGAYVALGSVLLGIRSDRLVSTLVGLWAVAVAILAVLIGGGATRAVDVLLAAVIAAQVIVYGTVAFIAWVTFGLIGLRLLGHLPDPAPAAHRETS